MESSPEARGSAEPAIKRALTELDRLLRGEVTQTASLQRGAIDVDPGRLSLVAIVLSMVYGACMGTFALFSARSGRAKGTLGRAKGGKGPGGPRELLPWGSHRSGSVGDLGGQPPRSTRPGTLLTP